MAIFSVYFDESGSPDDTAALVVAGFLANIEQWEKFQSDWEEVLNRFKVTALHMKQFAHSRGEYRDWKGNEGKRKIFLTSLIKVIRNRTKHSFAEAVLMHDYRQVNGTYYLSEIFKPYTIAARTCIKKVHDWADEHGIPRDNIAYIFEDGAQDKGDLMHRLKTDGISKYGFLPKQGSVAFQAADLLAYEHLLANTRIARGELQFWDQLRRPLQALSKVPNGKDGKDWGVFSARNLR